MTLLRPSRESAGLDLRAEACALCRLGKIVTAAHFLPGATRRMATQGAISHDEALDDASSTREGQGDPNRLDTSLSERTTQDGNVAADAVLPSVGRLQAFLHLLSPSEMARNLVLAEPPSVWNSAFAGAQAALVILIALPAVQLSPRPHLIGFAALGALPALFGRFHPPEERGRIVALCGLWQTIAVGSMSALSLFTSNEHLILLGLAAACGIFYFVTATIRPGPPGALIFMFAGGAAITPITAWSVVLERMAVTAAVSGLSWLICALTERWRQRATPERRFPMDPQRPLVARSRVSLRVAVAAAGALFIAHALGAERPEWAAMGAVAVMQGVHLRVKMERAIQRTIGTLIGAVLVWLILVAEPNAWIVIASVAAFQFLTEVIIGYNYALGQIVITPMALLMAYLAAPPGGADPSMAGERFISTLIGASLGLVFAIAVSDAEARRELIHGPCR